MTVSEIKPTARSARDYSLGKLARIGLGPGMAVALVCALSGCGVDYASSDPGFPGDFRESHPIVLASAPTSLEVYPIGGALDARAVTDLRAFAERYRRLGSGQILILTPGRQAVDSRAVAQIRRTLAGAGVSGGVGVASYPPSGGDSALPIRAAFIGLKAEVKTPCGLWPEDLASGSSLEGWKNQPYTNFGCGTQATIAAQVDDPRDFVQSQALGRSDVAMRTRAIENVRKGQDPGTAWVTGLTPIGGGSN
jgi:pilus assembly protein CpaD